MKALILGFVVIIAAVLTILPAGLGWAPDVLAFLRGSLPVIGACVGLILLFVGISDIKDRSDAKKEEARSRTETSRTEQD